MESGHSFVSQLRTALEAAPETPRFVLGSGDLSIDALALIDRVIVVGLPVSDTCKEVADGLVRRTVPRETLVELTGPWLITREALLYALDRLDAGAVVDDPLQLCRAVSLPIRVVIKP